MPLPLPHRPPAREDPPTAPWTSPSASSPTGSLNHIPILLGIPTDSTSSETALAGARRRNLPLALHLIDIDGFKQINDGFGHAGGDALLVEISNRMQSC